MLRTQVILSDLWHEDLRVISRGHSKCGCEGPHLTTPALETERPLGLPAWQPSVLVKFWVNEKPHLKKQLFTTQNNTGLCPRLQICGPTGSVCDKWLRVFSVQAWRCTKQVKIEPCSPTRKKEDNDSAGKRLASLWNPNTSILCYCVKQASLGARCMFSGTASSLVKAV